MSAVTSDLLTAQDISVDSRAHPSYIVVWLKHSKNDPFAVGTRVCIGATNQSMSSHCTIGLASYTPEEVGTLVHLPEWVYVIAREACLVSSPSFVGCGCEHSALQQAQLSYWCCNHGS